MRYYRKKLTLKIRLTKFSAILPCLILTSATLLPSCKKGSHCEDVPTVFYPVPAKDYAAIPYHGRDTLLFLHNKKDTVTYYGQGKFTSKVHYSDLQGDCFISEQDLETYFIRFKSSEISQEFKVMLTTDKGGGSSRFTFDSQFCSIKTSTGELLIPNFAIPKLEVLGKEYIKVLSNNCLLYNKEAGVIRIRTESDTLELLPS